MFFFPSPCFPWRRSDPTNETKGLSRYVKALGLLFDASVSAVQLVSSWGAGGRATRPRLPRSRRDSWRAAGCRCSAAGDVHLATQA